MVTKKTSNEDVKKVSTSVKAKKTVKPAVKKPEAEKATAAKVSVKKVAAKKAKTDHMPATANKDVVDTVLEIKAKNETKKAAKSKTATVLNETISEVAEKGAKATFTKTKRDAVKENAQKAEAKKFMAMKEENVAQSNGSCCFCLCGLKNAFAAWLDAYKKIFTYKSRTNRCDFWAFMLINFLVMLCVIIPYEYSNYSTLLYGTSITPAKIYAYWAFSIIELFVYLALYVRRLHDTGIGGWKGFFAPMTYSALGLVVLAFAGNYVIPMDQPVSKNASMIASLLGIAVIILLLINLFYLIKTFIAAGFMEEDRAENAYGAPKFMDDCCKGKILCYATWYALLMVIYFIIMFSVQFSLYMRLLNRGFM